MIIGNVGITMFLNQWRQTLPPRRLLLE